ncbi:ammonium transporter [Pseudonocardia hydrocarbonoxydans]|uniref:Ammonium transporter n=2 Tax=Pseudonocardia hydrocarbonoxydans TaxID=76726 RepID=A0A4Y3WQH4_9PSEU|nr:ammonium transporter [Pseudonocardia hydrocarbonoxydans]
MPDTGDTAWMMTATALVLLMTPGLALFYGGMVRSKSVLNMMMMSFASIGLVGVLWVLYGYSMTFGTSVGDAGIVGDPGQFLGLQGLTAGTYLADAEAGTDVAVPLVGTIPSLVFVGFQATFAIITVALISGAVADRMKFGSWLVFAGIWVSVVYFPVAHWVFNFDDVTAGAGGWIANDLAAIDFAGGTAVHINAGIAALVLAIVLGKRRGWPREPMRPHNLTLVMLGAALLWFGWFGFNAGSAVGSGAISGFAFLNTIVATAAAMIAWLLVERFRDGHPTSLGAASGVVAGLVAITPACSSVSPMGAIAVGAIAGVLCALAVGLKFRFGFDDSLDVVGVHLVGGLVGTLLIGFFATADSPAGVAGLFYGGGADQLWRQAVGAVAVLVYSGVVTAIIAFALKFTIGLRVSDEDEITGIDETEHAESGYDFSTLRGGSGLRPSAGASTQSARDHEPATAGQEV